MWQGRCKILQSPRNENLFSLEIFTGYFFNRNRVTAYERVLEKWVLLCCGGIYIQNFKECYFRNNVIYVPYLLFSSRPNQTFQVKKHLYRPRQALIFPAG
jgi:hypothetical protein